MVLLWLDADMASSREPKRAASGQQRLVGYDVTDTPRSRYPSQQRWLRSLIDTRQETISQGFLQKMRCNHDAARVCGCSNKHPPSISTPKMQSSNGNVVSSCHQISEATSCRSRPSPRGHPSSYTLSPLPTQRDQYARSIGPKFP